MFVVVAGAVVSIAASWRLVDRLERVGVAFGWSEALLGMLAALAADGPEITTAVSAIGGGHARVGATVALGANLFNLAALLGVAAIVAGPLVVPRRIVGLEGAVTLWVVAIALLAVLGTVPVWAGFVLAVVVLGPYLWVHGGDAEPMHGEAPAAAAEAVGPTGGRRDLPVLLIAAGVVVGASVAMERAAVSLGSRAGVAPVLVGGLALAAVTSVPNVIAGVYLARRGRGAAAWSTSLHSNVINLAAGLLLPGAVVGLGAVSGPVRFVAVANLVLTLLVIGAAWLRGGVSRSLGVAIIAAYAAFVVLLIVGV